MKLQKFKKKLLASIGASTVERAHQPSSRDYWGDQRYLEKSEFLYILRVNKVFEKITQVPGHIVELGVAYGRNAVLFSHLMRIYSQEDIRKYIGFDTFDGYSDESLESESQLSGDSWRDISIKDVKKRIKASGRFTNYELVSGDITKTLPEYLDNNSNLRVALLYVDCNSYIPALAGMRAIKEFMSPGGIICIDEKRQGGETKALIEFCQENNLKFMRDNTPYSMPAYTCLP